MDETREIIDVTIANCKNGMSAVATTPPHKNVVFRIQEIMLGMGTKRMAVPYTKFFLSPGAECRAEVLKNGKIRII